MSVQEVEYPSIARKPGVTLARAFQIMHGTTCIGVMYAIEPAADDGGDLIHVSISKSASGDPQRVTNWDIQEVAQVIVKRGLKWPESHELILFEAGPFARRGVHVWQTTEPTP